MVKKKMISISSIDGLNESRYKSIMINKGINKKIKKFWKITQKILSN